MAKIAVLGGTGYGGAAVVREAAKRGHEVTAYSRTAPAEPVTTVTYSQGSLVDIDVLSAAIKGQDVVFFALSPRGDMAGKVEHIVDRLTELCAAVDVRLGILGGASSLLVSEGGQRVFEAFPPPPEVRPEVETGLALLEMMRDAPGDLDWFFVSPPLEFGSWAPVPATGSYRISDDVLLTQPDGSSKIGAEDLAKAIVDEIENPMNRRTRFHVAL